MHASLHLEGAVELSMVAIDDVQHKGLQGVGGNQSMMGAQDPALIVAPSLNLNTYSSNKSNVLHNIYLESKIIWEEV